MSHKVRIFFPEFNIRLYDKNSEIDLFSLHQDQNIFFSNFGNQNIFLEKNHNPPFKLNGCSLMVLTEVHLTRITLNKKMCLCQPYLLNCKNCFLYLELHFTLLPNNEMIVSILILHIVSCCYCVYTCTY